MLDSLHIAATGMNAQQRNIDAIANNLANLNTPGYKKTRIRFEDLMYSSMGSSQAAAGGAAQALRLGMGTAVASAQKSFLAGDLASTGNNLDFAIRGGGFFEVTLPDGSSAYTRTGSFQVSQDRTLANADGHMLSPMIEVPIDAEDVLVKPDGGVLAKISGEDELVDIGRIELAQFINQSGLEPIGDNLYRPTHESGDALYSDPGEEGTGLIAQGFVESSNVQMIEELTQMMLAQRAYEVNSRVIQASDELLAIANNLRR